MAKKYDRDYSDYIDIKKIPILPLDNRWHQLFDGIEKPSNIKKLEKEVMNLVKKEGSVNQDLKQLTKMKKKLMKEIVANMQENPNDESDEKLRQKKVDASQKLILDINEKTTNLENEKYQLPYRLMKMNEELLYESIELCYARLEGNQEKINQLGLWIDKTRIQLKKNVIVKEELQDTNNQIYSYMHDILGPEFMQVFDENHEFKN